MANFENGRRNARSRSVAASRPPRTADSAPRINVQAKHERKITNQEKVAGADVLSDRKKRLRRLADRDGYANGMVWIPGPLGERTRAEILAQVRNVVDRHAEESDRMLVVASLIEGIEIQTDGEKLAQRIADALAKSRRARVSRFYDDEGRRRVLTCVLPEAARPAKEAG
jgi:hypothetical protein